MVIGDGERIVFQRPIPMGGNHFTSALAKDLKLTFDEAEHLKRDVAKSPELTNIFKTLMPVFNDYVAEVQRSLGYFTNTHREAELTAFLLVGNGLRIPGTREFIEAKLAMKVQKYD